MKKRKRGSIERFVPSTSLRDQSGRRRKEQKKRKRYKDKKLFTFQSKNKSQPIVLPCERKIPLTRATAPLYEQQQRLLKKYPGRFKSTSVSDFVCRCGHRFDPSKYISSNWDRHFKLCDTKQKKRLSFFGKTKLTPITDPKQRTAQQLDPAVVCDGLWSRKILGIKVDGNFTVSCNEFHGEPDYVFYRKENDGTISKQKGTFRSNNCLKVAVIPGTHKPNGTSTCNFCARLVLNKTFVNHIKGSKTAAGKFARNDRLSLSAAKTKLREQSMQIRMLRQHR